MAVGILFAVLLFSALANSSEQITAVLELREEMPINTTIGSLRNNLPTYTGSKVTFIYSEDFFTVDPQTGDVRVSDVLDRETLCAAYKQCCGAIRCSIFRTIYVANSANRDVMASIQLELQIIDVNDNRPEFASPIQRVSIQENSKIGRHIGLRPATDADVDPINQIQRYQWSEPTLTFTLDQNDLPDIRLRLAAPIDREMRATYTANLSACDLSSCTTSEVIIDVEDMNDNSPQFFQRQYRLELSESHEVGSTVLRLNATDSDSGDNARVIYSFRRPVDRDLTDTFEIAANSGDIRLRRPLDAKIRSSYNFKAVACDSIASDCLGDDSSTVDIDITVKDVNDNRPIIEIVPAGEFASSTNGLVIQENAPAGQIAVVKVKDADIGENARTSCDLDTPMSPPTFELFRSAPDLYSLRTLRVFDFEQESIVTTSIRCRDFGSPPLTSKLTVTLRIQDVNEHVPEFQIPVFDASIPENSPPGVKIVTLNAIDRDGQSELIYTLAPPPLQQTIGGNPEDLYELDSTGSYDNVGVNKHFSLDPKTGVLRTSRVQLDREAIERITLVVTVTDSVTQPVFTATATVSIEVLDENDNSPVFVVPPANTGLPFHQDAIKNYAFTVRENAPKYTVLSDRLEARDPDAGQNGKLHFSLRSVWALKGGSVPQGHSAIGIDDLVSSPGRQLVEQRLFQITPDGGIETLVEFDREQVSMYLLNVAVRDNGSQPLATLATLLVLILDENDNAPVWTFPAESARQINITTGNPPGSQVARLQAFDIDAEEAGRVDFQVLDHSGQPMPPVTLSRGLYNAPPSNGATQTSNNPGELMGYRTGPFYLNGSTGQILVADRLVPMVFKIRLRAIDSGASQRLFTDTWMIVNVRLDPNEFGGRAGAVNVIIILVMIAITAVISLLLIVAIVCVRRKPAREVIANGAVAGTDYIGGGPVIGCTPSSPYMMPANSKEGLAANNWSESKDFYPGSLILDENGQVVSTGAFSYGSPVMGSSDRASGICSGGLQTQCSLYSPLELNGDPSNGSAGGVVPLHTFGLPLEFQTLSKNHISEPFGTIHVSTQGARMTGSMQYEPHLDVDSGDSGRGPSEDGNQLMMLDNGRVFSPHPGYQYGTYTGYRPSSRAGYGIRSASAIGNPIGGASARSFVQQHPQNDHSYPGYIDNQSACPPANFGDYTDGYHQGAPLPQSPLGSYRQFLSGTAQPSPGPRRFTPTIGGEQPISASFGSLSRSRAPSRSTVTFHSPSVGPSLETSHQPIKLDLRGPGEAQAREVDFTTLPPRPAPRPVMTNLDIDN